MVDVGMVYVCRCGEKFSSERQLKIHVYEPLAPAQEDPQATSPRMPALAA